ncbi:hypothetical protein DFJ43DRAFT_116902 [Lentinula guzmanii]|uniref:Uncharacterized protein n=1 Tax=Lentinula guzmanii TaxID=2804957 RepID=A0AA38JCI0_9AGAR|nr:hypothetical protein DFJ43DRAFT_116902 [Lentinula guzmanii]
MSLETNLYLLQVLMCICFVLSSEFYTQSEHPVASALNPFSAGPDDEGCYLTSRYIELVHLYVDSCWYHISGNVIYQRGYLTVRLKRGDGEHICK